MIRLYETFPQMTYAKWTPCQILPINVKSPAIQHLHVNCAFVWNVISFTATVVVQQTWKTHHFPVRFVSIIYSLNIGCIVCSITADILFDFLNVLCCYAKWGTRKPFYSPCCILKISMPTHTSTHSWQMRCLCNWYAFNVFHCTKKCCKKCHRSIFCDTIQYCWLAFSFIFHWNYNWPLKFPFQKSYWECLRKRNWYIGHFAIPFSAIVYTTKV